MSLALKVAVQPLQYQDFLFCKGARKLSSSWIMKEDLYNAVSTTTALLHLSNPVTYQHSFCRLAGCIFGILGVWLGGHRGTGLGLQLYCFLRGCNKRSSSESHHHRKWYTERHKKGQSSSPGLPREQPTTVNWETVYIPMSPLELGSLWDQVVIKYYTAIIEIQISPRCEFRGSSALEAVGMTIACMLLSSR